MEVAVNKLLTGMVLEQLGFEGAEDTSIPQILQKIYPKGGTALRDSLINGCMMIIKLYELLQKTGTASNWNFAHVILTDGEDQHSKADLETTVQIMAIIGKQLNVKVLKIDIEQAYTQIT